MKRTIFFLILGLTSSILTYYLGNEVLVPKNEEGELIITNIIIMAIFSNVAIISFFTIIHTAVESLSQKSEKEKETTAIRRGIILAVYLDFLGFLKIFNLWSVLNALLALGIVIMLEMFLISIKPKTSPSLDEKRYGKNI